MKFYQEITEWKDGGNATNHTYLLSANKMKMYAYIKRGTKKVLEFKKPIDIDIRGRKFKEVPNTWNFKSEEEQEIAVGRQYKVVGSKNNVYTVTDDNGSWSCTCPASKWQKGECKHIVQLKI